MSDDRLERNVIIARSGVYQYTLDELSRMEGIDVSAIPESYKDQRWFGVYTPAEVILEASPLFTKLPITKEHPNTPVNPDNFKELAIGWSGDSTSIVPVIDSKEIGIQSTCVLADRDGLDYYDKNVRDVSPGYYARYKWEPGKTADGEEYQIVKHAIDKVNHLAFTQMGRGGPEISMDSLWYADPSTYDKMTMDSIWDSEMSKDSEFKESDHPRSENGQFGNGGSSGVSLSTSSYMERRKRVQSGTPPNTIRGEDIKRYSEAIDKYPNVKKAPREQKVAIGEYTGENYTKINEYARTGKANGQEREYQAVINGCSEYIDNNRLIEDTPLFRGINKDIGIEPGRELSIRGIASFTNSDIIARSFTDGSEEGVIMEIRGMKGSPVAPVNGHSAYGDEETEYIMKPDTKLRCISKERIDGRWFCQMEIVA